MSPALNTPVAYSVGRKETDEEDKMRRFVIGALLIALLLAGCTGPTPATPTDAPAGDVPAASAAEEGGTISAAGSTTVQPLAQLLGEAFVAANPGVRIEVQGGGSSVGVKSAVQGTADIGMASREIKASELEEYPSMQVFAIAYDGIAPVVHPDVAVDGLTLEQVRDIFAGVITNWQEVGGADALIVVVAREEGSGTRDAFDELVMGDELITDLALLQQSNGAVRTTVATTPNAIGFLSFGYLDESVKAVAVNGAVPNAENVKNGSYPVVRPLNMVTDGEPEGLVKTWLDWILGEDGQAIVVEEGYIAAD
jgi:phosphate transport system substrate-binding protein